MSRYRPAIFLVPILLIQIFLSLPRLNDPNLDGRLHWYWCNAFFLLKAKHSNTPPPPELAGTRADALRFFGMANYAYDAGGKPVDIRLYSHHPILTPTLFRLYTRMFGYDTWVPRSFMLILSLLTTWVLFAFLRAELREDRTCAFLVLLYTLLPLYFMYMDQWKDENMGTLLVLLCFYLLTRAPVSGLYRALFLICFFLVFQAAWMSYYSAPFILLYLYRKRNHRGWERLHVYAAGVLIVSVGLNFAVLYQLGFNWTEIRAIGAGRLSGGLNRIGVSDWALRQWGYLQTNFGDINLALYGMGMGFLLLRRKVSSSLLLFASFTFTASLLCHVGLFRSLSWIHHYVQWSFGPAYVLLLAGIVSDLRKVFPENGAARTIQAAVMITLFVFTAAGSRQFEKSIRSSTFGHVSDLDSIRTLQRRLLVFSDGRSGPVDWWSGPVIDLARDPLFQGRSDIGPIERIETLRDPDPKRDVLVVLNAREALATLPAYLEERFGVTGLRAVRRSHSFTFFEMLR
ncbi:MAG: glycosyltransferase family 39 protein [Deltaproteobacteria bacterium]|nr:glycosyltransferase family 39 protein [Deltaproteobacteria bacterium]